jgi:hypothetical protein
MPNINTDDYATNPVVVAMLGSILGLKAWPGTSWLEKFLNVMLGFVIAIIVGPALVDYFSILSVKLGAAVIFASGSCGLVLFASIIEGIRQTKFGDIIKGWFAKPAASGERHDE